jgi:hypothetical protein
VSHSPDSYTEEEILLDRQTARLGQGDEVEEEEERRWPIAAHRAL